MPGSFGLSRIWLCWQPLAGGKTSAVLDHSLVLALGVHLSKTIGLKGWVGIDFKVDALGHCYILEINPRYTASMELGERGHNQSFAKGHVACVKGEEWNGFSFHSDPVPQTKAILYSKNRSLYRLVFHGPR